VAGERPDDPPPPGKPRVRADEDEVGSRFDEEVDERLRQAAVDVSRSFGGALAAIVPRVVDVDVEAVLVRDVPGEPEARPEVAAPRTAQVADPDAGRTRMRGGVRAKHPQHDSDEPVGAPAAPAAVRRRPAHGIPREERLAFGGKLDAAHEPAAVGEPERFRVAPSDPRCCALALPPIGPRRRAGRARRPRDLGARRRFYSLVSPRFPIVGVVAPRACSCKDDKSERHEAPHPKPLYGGRATGSPATVPAAPVYVPSR